jgi:hypothetical protein
VIPNQFWSVAMINKKANLNISLVQTALKNYHDRIGKETMPHHYINEVRLIRYAMTGDFKTAFDFINLSGEQQRVLRRIICMNCRLIKSHVDYKLRKQACRELVIKQSEKTNSNT